MKKIYLHLFISLFVVASATAQTVLVSENFDDKCPDLPAGWEVKINGNQAAVWYIGTPTNTNSDSTSIDGSCMVVIDDDKTGENTPGFVWEMWSPAFDASNFTTVKLSADIHYRDWEGAAESFSVWVTDGQTTEKLLELGNGQTTGAQFSEFKNFTFDLAFGFSKPNVRLIFRYDDGNDWDWWAGFDNVKVTGEGAGTNVVLENFNTCQKPAGWETEILSGDFDWKFAPDSVPNPKYYGVNTMNGSCFAFFDDDLLGADAKYSTARLKTWWFDGSEFANFNLNFDVVHRFYSETLVILVENGAGEEQVVQSWSSDIGGPLWDDFVNLDLDLSKFRDKQMRVIFEYTDGNDYGWWTGIDNVKISGTGIGNDVCSRAIDLTTGAACLSANNRTAIFDGPASACAKKSVGGLWFRWQADATGWAKISTNSNFNEVVAVFSGGCANPQILNCDNRDEHGFTSENTFFQATTGQFYLIRVSGEAGGFGDSRGDFCLKIEKNSPPPAVPANDICQNAKAISIDAACSTGNNLNAKILDTQFPSRDKLARADVWFSFQAPNLAANEILELKTNADFSDVITVFRGGCANLTEVAATEFGQNLELKNLIAGQNYRIQIAGTFATVEGNFCLELKKINATAPANDDCISAKAVPLGGSCVSGNTDFAAAGGLRPDCAVSVSQDVWFKFTAPLSGSVHINSGADFEHVAAVWEGNCTNLVPVFCIENPLRCAGYFTVGELVPGKTYFLQIASTEATTNFSGGEVCVKILDGIAPPDYFPFEIKITEECTGIATAKLVIETIGGQSPFQITDPSGGQNLASGTDYLVVARDKNGCEVSVSGIVDDCTEAQCLLAATAIVFQPTCHDATDGSILAEISGGATPYIYVWSVAGQTNPSLTGLAAGVYYLTATDSEGCETIISRTLTNPEAILAAVSSFTEPNVGQSNGEIVVGLTNGTAPFSYQWTRDGVQISTQKDLFGVPGGTYVLQITDANGCTATLSQILKETVAAGEPADGFLATISPNPASGFTFLNLKLPAAADVEISLCDAAGKVLNTFFEKNLSEKQVRVDVDRLPAGVYQLKIKFGERRVVRKVVVI